MAVIRVKRLGFLCWARHNTGQPSRALSAAAPISRQSWPSLNMRDSFHILDLVSQAAAVQRLLKGKPLEDKIAWLSIHGQIRPKAKTSPQEHQVYHFASPLGFTCHFFIHEDRFVFIGPHTTFSVAE